MSRIGNMPIAIPTGVEVKIEGQHITVKGPKGSLERDIHPNIKVELDGNEIKVSRPDDTKMNKSLHGTTRALIHNMVEGVVNEFKVELEINGVGYRAQKKGTKLVMNLGYSHPNESIEPYILLIKNKYLTESKTTNHLLYNFISNSGHRYASNKQYEYHLRSIYNKISNNEIGDLWRSYQRV